MWWSSLIPAYWIFTFPLSRSFCVCSATSSFSPVVTSALAGTARPASPNVHCAVQPLFKRSGSTKRPLFSLSGLCCRHFTYMQFIVSQYCIVRLRCAWQPGGGIENDTRLPCNFTHPRKTGSNGSAKLLPLGLTLLHKVLHYETCRQVTEFSLFAFASLHRHALLHIIIIPVLHTYDRNI